MRSKTLVVINLQLHPILDKTDKIMLGSLLHLRVLFDIISLCTNQSILLCQVVLFNVCIARST